MAETDLLWMSAVVFIPAVFALVLIFFPRGKEEAMRWWSLFGTALTLGVSIGMFILFYNNVIDENNVRSGLEENRRWASLDSRSFNLSTGKISDVQRSRDWLTSYPWIERFHIDYFLGADGISMPLVLLTTVLSFLAMIASWKIDKFVRGYCMLFLLLETGMLGTFLALDFFLFYIFWEVMLLPMYFLIGVWGGPRREYAAIKFFLYTLLGSVFILIALLGLLLHGRARFRRSARHGRWPSSSGCTKTPRHEPGHGREDDGSPHLRPHRLAACRQGGLADAQRRAGDHRRQRQPGRAESPRPQGEGHRRGSPARRRPS